MSKRFDWAKNLVPQKEISGLPPMNGPSVPSSAPDRTPHDPKRLRKEVKTLQEKNYKGAKK